MNTRVKRHTDKTSRRIAKLERELQEAQTRISELTARMLIMGAGLGYQPLQQAVGSDLVDATVIPFQARETAAATTGEATVIPFRSRG